MSTARIATLICFTMSISMAAFAIMVPALPAAGLRQVGISDSLVYSLFLDGAARLGVGIFVFGGVFGLAAALCNFHFGARPLAELAEKLNARPHEVGSNQRDFLIERLSDSVPLREPFAKLRLQLGMRSSPNSGDTDTPTLPLPAQQLIAQSSLLRACVSEWFMRAIALLMLTMGAMLLAWSLASGADAQAQNAANMAYGHPSGALLGLRSGSFAVLCALLGAGSVYFLGVGSHAYAASQAEKVIAKINGITLISSASDTSEGGALNLVTVQPDTLSAADLEKIVISSANKISTGLSEKQGELNAQLQNLINNLTQQISESQSKMIAGQVQIAAQLSEKMAQVSKNGLTKSAETEKQLGELLGKISVLTQASTQNAPALNDIAQALTEVKVALSDLHTESQRLPSIRGNAMPLVPDSDAARKLSSAIKALRIASDVAPIQS